MIGIYKYQNKINGHIYIGQSINLEQRKCNHKNAAFNENACDYNCQFHQAIRKYGWDNFDYEVIAEITPEEYSQSLLNELEKFFIKYYNSFENGYNATEGGDHVIGNTIQKGEKIGEVTFELNGETIATVNLVSDKEVKKVNVWNVTTNIYKKWFNLMR